MKSAVIHGVLLLVMLVYGYRTWTRDKSVKPNYGDVVLWNKRDSDLVAIEYKSDKKTVKLERRGDGANAYWWGTETTIEKKPKPVDKKDDKKPDAGSGSAGSGSAAKAAGSGSAGSGSAVAKTDAKAGSGSAGSGSAVAKTDGKAGSGSAGSGSAGSGSAGSGSAVAQGSGSATPPPPPEMIETTKKREFPLGEAGDKIVKGYTEARAIRDLGKPTDDQKKDYKLVDSKTTLTITFKDGARTFLVGGSVYGQSDRYVMDQQSGVAYVLSKDIISGLELGESSLHLVDPRGFDATKIENVTLDWNGRTKSAIRVTTGDGEKQVKSWGDPDTKKPNVPLATFIDNANNLRPTEYVAELNASSLQPVMKLTYKDAKGEVLGTLQLLKGEKPADVPTDADFDPANPPKGEVQYYVLTEKTHVPALVRKDTAQRSEQDLPIAFGDKAPPVEPKGNPFGNVKPGGAPPGGNPVFPTVPNPPGGAPQNNPHAPGGPSPFPPPQKGATPPTPPGP
ncbi:MAG TPA: DUF4340 domain-containing protein [Kofleriaceae bacterium]|nr:DUF4340 domain-containing protein [Kofleriaceae bacterium]